MIKKFRLTSAAMFNTKEFFFYFIFRQRDYIVANVKFMYWLDAISCVEISKGENPTFGTIIHEHII